jgi:adenosylhomocysteine nucleosidase
MARIGIISAMQVEIEGIIEKFSAQEVIVTGFYKLYEGSYKGSEVILACSGIGKVNAACCTQKLIDYYDVDCVINMGIAGGISPTIGQLDVVIASEVIYHDFSPAELLIKYYPFTRSFKCDEKLIAIAAKVCEDCTEVKKSITGIVASGDCFVEDSATKERIASLGGLCCEMEGAAVGHVCHNNSMPFIIIRSISDLADESAQMSYEEFEKLAALQANRIVEGIIKLL